MNKIMEPRYRGQSEQGFVGVTGGVMNCLHNTTSLNDNQAKYSYKSAISAPPVKTSKYLIVILCVLIPLTILRFLCLVVAVAGAILL